MIRASALHKHVEYAPLLKGIFELSTAKLQSLKESFGVTNELSGVVFTQGQRLFLYSEMNTAFNPHNQFDRNVPVTKDYEVKSEIFEKAIISASNTQKGVQITIIQDGVLPIQNTMPGQSEDIFPMLLQSTMSALCLPKDLLLKVEQEQQAAMIITRGKEDYDASFVYKLSLDKSNPTEPVIKMEFVDNNRSTTHSINDIRAQKKRILNESQVVYVISPT